MKQLLSIFAFGFLCATIAFSEGESGSGSIQVMGSSELASPAQTAPAATVTMRFYNRTVYYPGNSPSEPVVISVTIRNDQPETLHFKLADDHFFSLDFKAVNTRNQPLDHTDKWLRNRSTSKQVYFREISLEPGESYSFTENVKDYLTIANPGMYVLECSFYPELKRLPDDSEMSVKSNRLTLDVKPSPGAAAVKVLPVSPVTAEVLQPVAMPPDEVVTYIITARQQSHWNQFFLYFDLDEMIQRDPARKRRFNASSENARYQMIEDYKTEMTQAKVDSDISTIPVEFEIEKTAYAKTEGTVSVIEWFNYSTYSEKKRFTYFLASRDGIWRVVDYTVDNLGTEAKRNYK